MRIVSYNIHRAKDRCNVNTLSEIIDYLKDLECDVICLQEVLYSQFKTFKTQLEMGGIFGENVKKNKYGICILTDEEIIESKHKFLTSKKEQRGFVYVKIKNKIGEYFNVLNTHLGLDKEERITQIDEVLDFVYNMSVGYSNNIICGDFNEKNVCIGNFEDVGIFSKDSSPTFNTSRIDYCFMDKEMTINSYKVDNVEYSDHYPIIIDFF